MPLHKSSISNIDLILALLATRIKNQMITQMIECHYSSHLTEPQKRSRQKMPCVWSNPPYPNISKLLSMLWKIIDQQNSKILNQLLRVHKTGRGKGNRKRRTLWTVNGAKGKYPSKVVKTPWKPFGGPWQVKCLMYKEAEKEAVIKTPQGLFKGSFPMTLLTVHSLDKTHPFE